MLKLGAIAILSGNTIFCHTAVGAAAAWKIESAPKKVLMANACSGGKNCFISARSGLSLGRNISWL
jgi:hypothetical protein